MVFAKYLPKGKVSRLELRRLAAKFAVKFAVPDLDPAVEFHTDESGVLLSGVDTNRAELVAAINALGLRLQLQADRA